MKQRFPIALALTLLSLLAWPALAAALAPGDLDPAFGSGGAALVPSGVSSEFDAVALQPDGKILLGGGTTDASGNTAALLTRLNADGSPDGSFGIGGSVVKQFGSGDPAVSRVHAIALQPDGKILIGTDGPLVVRLDSSGNLDRTFGTGGEALAPAEADAIDPSIWALGFAPDGSIVVAGTRGIGTVSQLIVGRLDTTGKRISSFGNRGLVETLVRVISHESDLGRALAVQPDGKVVVAGDANEPSSDALMVVRLNGGDGSFDDGFGDHGKVLFEPFGTECGASAVGNGLVLQPDGRLVIAGGAMDPLGCAGASRSPSLITRLSGANGAFDPGFGSGGTLFTDMPNGPASWNAVALQPDGRLVVGGTATDAAGKSELSIARLDSAGGFDPSFAAGGQFLRQLGDGSGVHALALQPDGNIVAAGSAGKQAVALRLLGQAPPPPPPGGGQGGQPGPNTPGPVVATISHLGIVPAVFSAADRGPSIARTIGATVSYENTAAVTTLFTVFRRARGVMHKHRCMKPKRGRRGRGCTRWVVQGRFTHADRVGRNSFHFTGRVAGHKLRPGHYRLRARPRFLGPSAVALTVPFRIVR